MDDSTIRNNHFSQQGTKLGFTLWSTNIAIENGHLYIVSLSIKNGDFPVRYVNVYQRVYGYLMDTFMALKLWP